MQVLFCRFQQFLGMISALTTKEFSESGLFVHLSNHVFLSQQLQKYLSYETNFFFFFSKYLKFNVDSKNAITKQQSIVGFLDNSI